jgi:hypothetical protein
METEKLNSLLKPEPKNFRMGYLATWDSSGERMLRHAIEQLVKTDKKLLKDAQKTLYHEDAYTRGIAAGMEIVLKAHIDLLTELVEKVEKQ